MRSLTTADFIPHMESTICLVMICAAFFKHGTQGLEGPETLPGRPKFSQHGPGDTIQFSWETVSRTEKYSLRGTTYYSASRGAYRFDANDGENKLFVLANDGWAFYSFPTSRAGQETSCRKMKLGQPPVPLPSAIPSNEGYDHLSGVTMYHGEPLWRYQIYPAPADRLFEMRELFFREGNLDYPVRSEYIRWASGPGTLRRDRLDTHEVTYYYGFTKIERDIGIWAIPSHCREVQFDTMMGRSIADHAKVVHSPEGLECIFTHECNRFNKASGVRYNIEPTETADVEEYPGSEYSDQDEDQVDLPLSWDWRDSGAVTSVKNQRYCGSCWAFGAVAAIESAYFLKHRESLVLSEQFLIDCAWTSSNEGCAKGSVKETFQWISKICGFPLSESYSPYKNMNGRCDRMKLDFRVNITGFESIGHTPYELKKALVDYGPIVVNIDAHPMINYRSGIINGTDCINKNRDHFVLVVGYGETKDHEPYWIVKNSWGNSWGMDGYALISARPDENCLDILHEPLFPIVQ